MNYKKAEMIELYDANVVLHKEDYSNAEVGWNGLVPEQGEKFIINGSEIADLLLTLGIESYPVYEGKRPSHPMSLENMEFTINRHNKDVGNDFRGDNGHQIKDLGVKIVNSLMLNIRFTAIYEEDGQTDIYTREITYSGSYTVWWTSDKETS